MKKFASMTPNPRFPSARITYAVRDAPLPPDPPAGPWTISGVIARDGTNAPGIAVVFAALGTATTNGSGVYSQSAADGYTGVATPYFSAGSFTPASRSYSDLSANQTSQDYAFYIAEGTENVLISRPGAFAIDFVATSSTGYFAVEDESGNVTIYANDSEVVLDFANTFCYLRPCFSATDAFNTGHITSIGASGVVGMSGSLDVSGLTQLVSLVIYSNEINDLNVTGCVALTDLSAYNCQMGVSEINAVLIQLDNNGASNGGAYLTGQGVPTGGGATAKANLIGKGWIVDTDT